MTAPENFDFDKWYGEQDTIAEARAKVRALAEGERQVVGGPTTRRRFMENYQGSRRTMPRP